MNIITILAILVKVTKSENYMAVVWGKPQTLIPTIYSNITNWSDCVQLCYDAGNCVIAYNRGYNASTEGCEIYGYYFVDKVDRYTIKTALGAKVAFKLNNYNPKTGCQNGTKPPTFSQNFASGEVENPARPALKPGYNVTLSNGVWQIKYNGKEYCVVKSSMSVRPGGAVCLSYFSYNTSLSLTDGKSSCAKNNNGKITGINNLDELWLVEAAFMKAQPAAQTLERVIWLDGARRKACQGSDWKTLPGCEGLKAFTFSDPFHASTEMYEWEDGAPLGKECLVMWAFSKSKPARVGKIRDIDCNATCTNAMCPTSISCWSPPL